MNCKFRLIEAVLPVFNSQDTIGIILQVKKKLLIVLLRAGREDEQNLWIFVT